MNVAFDPWIPVVSETGERMLASLNDVLVKGEQFADLAVRPHERVALMRLLLCVSHAALDGPKDYDEWCKVPERLPEVTNKYLLKWQDSFELFHKEKPWLQVVGLKYDVAGNDSDICQWTAVSKLNFSYATGDNTSLFDHEGMISETRQIPMHETILSMITFQCFSLGGLMGQVFWNNTRCGELANPKKDNGPVKSSDAPCSPQSMLHAFLRGKNLFETVYFNLPSFEDIRLSYSYFKAGRPIWEQMPLTLADTLNIENATMTYIGRLVPMARVIRLHVSAGKILLGNGLKYPGISDGFPQEPSATLFLRTIRNQEERALLTFQPSKGLWRELAAIIVKRNAEGIGGPLSLRNIQNGQECDLIVSALKRDKATIVDTVESLFHIPSRLRMQDGSEAYEEEVKVAETCANRLGWAIEDYRYEVDAGWPSRLKSAGSSKGELKAKLHSIATIHYWTTVEKNLPLLMAHIEAIDTDEAIPTRQKWQKMIFSAACEAYRTACGQETPRQIRAFAKGWQRLTSKTEEPDSEVNLIKEDEE